MTTSVSTSNGRSATKIEGHKRLERQVRNRGKKLQRSNHKLRYLSRRIGILERQLEDMRASRVWKLAEGLRRIRVRFKGLLTG